MLALGLIPVVALFAVLVAAVLVVHQTTVKKRHLETAADARRQKVLAADLDGDAEFVAAVADGRLPFVEARDRYRAQRGELLPAMASPADHWTTEHLNRRLAAELTRQIDSAKSNARRFVTLFTLFVLFTASVVEVVVYKSIAPEDVPTFSPLDATDFEQPAQPAPDPVTPSPPKKVSPSQDSPSTTPATPSSPTPTKSA